MTTMIDRTRRVTMPLSRLSRSASKTKLFYQPIRPIMTGTHADKLGQLTRSIQDWFDSPRFSNTQRSYSAELIATKRGSLPVHQDCYANLQARKLRKLLTDAQQTHQPVLTMGALDPVQQSQMAHHLPVVYVSGWAASSTFVPGTHEVGPDLADYPYHTVPTAVQRLVKAQQLHERKEWDAQCSETDMGREPVDYLKPIIADGDNGHGGLSTVMKLAKAFGEAGVAGVHFEDQLVGGKKCGHQAGKVLVPTCEHLSRLRAARMQWDIMGLETLLIGRTDAESAKLISSDHDPRDHRFILGIETSARTLKKALAEEIILAEERGASGEEINEMEKKWTDSVELITFDQAVGRAFERHQIPSSKYAEYLKEVEAKELSHQASSRLAIEMISTSTNGKQTPEKIGWNSQLARTREGYYRFNGCLQAAVNRALKFSPVADLVWIETKEPDLQKAQSIAAQIHHQFPNQNLVYNLSPSFNWSHHGFSDEDLKGFVWDLSRVGFNLQLISLAGLHSTATMTAQLAKRFKEDGMLGYVQSIQQVEKQIGCDVLKHQKWSGSEYIDRILSAVSAGSSATAATGADSTEKTF
ncbi:isocitrate lyase [Puccinia graminis f. sp. tritici CRL 75-36-700-3]|uniref:Isocitrate lyase n=1 Tax=Puccinia graminis f. sp. tritici (strain CRL 75-36-700-3 / race SCCL) TaxID=418459 RepID=E3K6J4_PUCGT|nr:isocitrate lyase [Puccinia graminis f. sp. tritici CRL 75-36-700-3]EFP80154.2 isocitrate lyase [Puccinia graminis f. sp. tritici CRL 75-36-700-3]